MECINNMGFTELIQEAVKNGIWALLFVALFIWTIKEQRIREAILNQTIKQVNDNILSTVCRTENKVDAVIEDVEDLKDNYQAIDKKVDVLSEKVNNIK